jgi:NADPH-dependent 7-cyano-7-deazaguanine reductase QueF-like protein
MSIKGTFEKIEEYDSDKYLQNQIAQLNARYILFNTNEDKKNFPNYKLNEDNLTLLGFQYLNLGCRLAESELIEDASSTLEKGAEILEYIYGSSNNEIKNRDYHVLISSLAYYSGFQYSKSFILIQKSEGDTIISSLVSFFLKRDFTQLQKLINEILIIEDYTSLTESKKVNKKKLPIRIYEIVIAKSLGKLVGYLNFGTQSLLEEVKEDLRTLKDIAEVRVEPDIWWVLRLLIIIIDGVEKASFWNVLGGYYSDLPLLAQKYIYSHVFSNHTKIHEFFSTQRKALEQVINKDDGLIVSMPTSSGKTRIAEVGILDCKIQNPISKILFIAPYRSLAFEIENDLEKVFTSTGIIVSQLYGGSLFNKLDEKIIEETDVIIATQEKAKALLRSNSEIINSIKLIILDEGHLLGDNDRYIRSELLIEELKYNIEKNEGKFILLSAVLPNPEELSNWLTFSSENLYKNNWRPSEERLGVLEWTGKRVNLNWQSSDDERDSFNRNFVVSEKLPRVKNQRKGDKFFPSDKNEAIAMTAHKLFNFGPVLVFVGIKASVFIIAKAYLKVLGLDIEDFPWKNQNNWKAFELSCIEFDGQNSKWLMYAKKGIICHNADLPENTRIALERLIRTEKPYIIIATSTLGQGVNLGVSSVIFSTLFQPIGNRQAPIDHGDFWNIAGRAGRAFVDHEGKILIALDKTKSSWHTARDTKLIEGFFDKSNINHVQSGLLTTIKHLKYFSLRFTGLNFNHFLQLISENTFDSLPSDIEKTIIEKLDLIDDTLLTLHKYLGSDDSLDVSWVEDYFRKSLAYLQISKDNEEITKKEFIKIIKHRVKGIVKSVGDDKANWQKHIGSGIPLQSDLKIEEQLDEIIGLISDFIESDDSSINNKIILLTKIETLINHVPILHEAYLANKDLELIRTLWLMGDSMQEINKIAGSKKIIKEHFSFKLPWILNGVARKLDGKGNEIASEILQELSILVETGLPNLIAVKIYQAGIRSRSASIEIAKLFSNDSWLLSVNFYKNKIFQNAEKIKSNVSENTIKWLELLLIYNLKHTRVISNIKPFVIKELSNWNGQLTPTNINKEGYLISTDFTIIYPISKIKGRDFSKVLNIDGISFYKNSIDNVWVLDNKNPNIEIQDSEGKSVDIV